MDIARPTPMKWIAPAAIISLILLAGAANLALDDDPRYDRDAFIECMRDPPLSGVGRDDLMEMTFGQIENVCDCHAGHCR